MSYYNVAFRFQILIQTLITMIFKKNSTEKEFSKNQDYESSWI